MKKLPNQNQIVIYQTKSGSLGLQLNTSKETILLTQNQVGELFGVQKAAISKHVNNIFASGELSRDSTVSKMETVQIEGGRQVRRYAEYYNLDLVLSVGYRVNSKRATAFRQWATKTLKQYIIEGYAVNKSRIAQNYRQFAQTIEDIKLLLPPDELIKTSDVLELISLYADTWVSLEAYDRGELEPKQITKKSVDLTAQKLGQALAELKANLIAKGQETELFGIEQNPGRLAGIVGNVMQSFAGSDLYPSVEEKSAHLLYFMIKD